MTKETGGTRQESERERRKKKRGKERERESEKEGEEEGRKNFEWESEIKRDGRASRQDLGSSVRRSTTSMLDERSVLFYGLTLSVNDFVRKILALPLSVASAHPGRSRCVSSVYL